MYSEFEKTYREDAFITSEVVNESRIAEGIPEEFYDFYEAYGGRSFGGGIYRVFAKTEVASWINNIAEMYPQLDNVVIPYGYDWLGRVFAICLNSKSNWNGKVLLIFPFEEEVVKIPADLKSFHNQVLIHNSEPALEVGLFSEFLKKNKLSALERSDCAALKKPVFLGGDFSIDNMHVENMDVYWTLNAQILNQVRSSL